MSSTQLEQLRQSLEDIDRLETGVVDFLSRRARTHGERLEKEHSVAECLTVAQGLATSALAKFDDKDGLLREERATMADGDVFSSFYLRLRDIREYHARFTQDADLVKRTVLSDIAPKMEFSGEEAMGRFLDLHELHEQYLNIPDVERIDYKTFLDRFASLDLLSDRAKSSGAFKQYLGALVRYLLSFLRRSQPLVDLSESIKGARAAFVAKHGAAAASGSGVSDAQLNSMPTVAALEAVGGDALKAGLAARGLKTGGSVKERAERLFSVKGLAPEQYPKKHLAKVTGGPAGGAGAGDAAPAAGAPGSLAFAVGIPETEGLVAADVLEWLKVLLGVLTEVLSDVIAESKARVIKKQTRTYAELTAELEAENEVVVESSSESEEDDEKPIYNPKNLPLGWDGKPIPYWLYKLHGLNQEFVCEICGDFSYWGRRNFDRHFQEPRHAYGMRRLGIPNTKHFHDVTSIKEALGLYQKLRTEIEAEAWKPEVEEEFEDSEGNVLSRKTFEDLARQGLL